jgi:hypothetical protein
MLLVAMQTLAFHPMSIGLAPDFTYIQLQRQRCM